MEFEIKKFKKIASAKVVLKPVNIFIGANNSGKSSLIQGIQFAVSSCQTLELEGVRWTRSETRTSSLDSTEFLYTPTRHIENLYHGKKLTGARTRENRAEISFGFTDDVGQKATLKISRGKNGGFTTVLHGKKLGTSLSSVKRPFCVYVPGIAGVPTQEKFEVSITVKKSATRGDSNNYLRNILYAISKDAKKWEAFTASVRAVYGEVGFRVSFDEELSEYIGVTANTQSLELPLDAVGTGMLQVVQIFAYIEYFQPKIILLDEPDSHIHPTKQKLLATELLRRADADEELKVVFSTHSRYILEALETKANVVHFQNGRVFEDVRNSSILVDIGAADADYLFKKRKLKFIVVTEDKVDDVDEKKAFLKTFLIANGLREEEFVLHSYEGCSKIDFAKILEGFVRKHVPTARVIVHADRDQRVDEDREVEKLKNDCESKGLLLFLTEYQEIESYFCLPEHLSAVYGLSLEEAQDIFTEFAEDLKEETRSKLINFIIRERPELGRNGSGKSDIRIMQRLVDAWLSKYEHRFTPGKELLGKIKNHMQSKLKKDPNRICQGSEGLRRTLISDLLDLEVKGKTSAKAGEPVVTKKGAKSRVQAK